MILLTFLFWARTVFIRRGDFKGKERQREKGKEETRKEGEQRKRERNKDEGESGREEKVVKAAVGCQNAPGATGASAVAGAAGPSARRSELRSRSRRRPEGAASLGGEVAQRVQLGPQEAGRSRERLSAQWGPAAAPDCPETPSASFVPPKPLPRPAQAALGRALPRDQRVPAACSIFFLGVWGEKQRARGGGREKMQKYHL